MSNEAPRDPAADSSRMTGPPVVADAPAAAPPATAPQTTIGRAARIWWFAFSFIAGLLVAVSFHYLLYRISLPLEPFVYVAF